MFKLRLPFILLAALAHVIRGRLTRGPLRPSWSWSTEIFTQLLRRIALTVNAMPLEEQGPIWESLAQPSPVLKQVLFEPVSKGSIRGEWVTPPTPTKRVVLYFHGGWYSGGSLKAYRELMARISLGSGARVFILDYRLAPQHPYPAAIDDAVEAWQWLTQGYGPGDIVVAGDSAGSGLALALQLRLRDARKPLPKASVLMCPWVDLATTGGSLVAHSQFDWGVPEEVAKRVKLYVGEGDPKQPEVSPVFADLRGLSPMLILAGGAEMLIDQERALAAKALAHGVSVTYEETPDMIHNWPMFAATLPPGMKALEQMAAFVRG